MWATYYIISLKNVENIYFLVFFFFFHFQTEDFFKSKPGSKSVKLYFYTFKVMLHNMLVINHYYNIGQSLPFLNTLENHI